MGDGGPDLPALFTLVPLIFVAVGAATVVQAIWGLVRERRFGRAALSASGEVTDVREYKRTHSTENGSRTVITFAPVVRFPLPDGRWVDAEVYEEASASPGVGSRVAVRYDADDPTHCRLDGGGRRRTGGAVGRIVFGLFFVVFGLAFLGVGRALEGL